MFDKLAAKTASFIRAKLSSSPEVGADLLAQSRAARVGHRLMQAAIMIKACEGALAVLVLLALAAAPALAQTPGGSIFGGDSEQLGRSIREIIKWGRNILFLLGIGGIMWGIVNFMMEKPWSKQIIGGMLCFMFGGIVAMVQAFAKGDSVNVDTSFSGN